MIVTNVRKSRSESPSVTVTTGVGALDRPYEVESERPPVGCEINPCTGILPGRL